MGFGLTAMTGGGAARNNCLLCSAICAEAGEEEQAQDHILLRQMRAAEALLFSRQLLRE